MKKAIHISVWLILLGFVAAGIFLTIAPDQIPAHYNMQGQIDRWGSKYEYLIMPFMNLLFGAFMLWMARHEEKKGRDMNGKTVAWVNVFILTQFDIMWVVFMWKALQGGDLGSTDEITSKLVMVLLAASFIPIGNLMPKAQRNSVFGLRTKWSNASDHCWQQSQRFGGFAMVITGVLGVILCAILPVTWGGIALVVLIALMAIVSTWMSYRIFLRSQVQ